MSYRRQKEASVTSSRVCAREATLSRGLLRPDHERAGRRVQGVERIRVRDEVATRALEVEHRGPPRSRPPACRSRCRGSGSALRRA